MKHWYDAEESFLNIFCNKKETDSLLHYSWMDGPWSKFNFLRLKGDSVDQAISEEIKDVVLKNNKAGLSTYFKCSKLPPNLVKSSNLSFEKVGIPIVHSSNKSCNFIKDKIEGSELVRVDSLEMFKQWWLINSDGRGREKPFDSVIFKKLSELNLKENHSFYILTYKGVPVTSFAVTSIEGGYNCWGLATVTTHQKKGFAAEVYNLFSRQIEESVLLYGQNNLNSYFLNCRKKKSCFNRYLVESCYEIL